MREYIVLDVAADLEDRGELELANRLRQALAEPRLEEYLADDHPTTIAVREELAHAIIMDGLPEILGNQTNVDLHCRKYAAYQYNYEQLTTFLNTIGPRFQPDEDSSNNPGPARHRTPGITSVHAATVSSTHIVLPETAV